MYLAAFILGIGGAVFALSLILINYLRGLGNPFSSMVSLKNFKPHIEASAQGNRDGIITVLSAVAGVVFGFLLALGTGAVLMISLVGAMVGTAGSVLIRHSIDGAKKRKTMREVAVLYETIDFFTRGQDGQDDHQHFTIQQALRYAAAITPTIRPLVQRCIDSWPRGPARALEGFAKEVNLPEANILSSVLIQAEVSGMRYGRSAIEEGSLDLEDLRHSMIEIGIASRPMYYAVYRGLPLAAIGGILLGALAYHMSTVLSMVFRF